MTLTRSNKVHGFEKVCRLALKGNRVYTPAGYTVGSVYSLGVITVLFWDKKSV